MDFFVFVISFSFFVNHLLELLVIAPITSNSVVRQLPSTKTIRDQSLAVVLVVRNLGELVCEYLPEQKKKRKRYW